MTPAALKALTSGQRENFIAAMTPGGIEAQEKAGQIEQSFAETLPIDLHGYGKDFEALGFVLGLKVDDCFQQAQWPKGWRKKPTDHSMWTEILDDKGRKRGMIFYKAAFYDRSAHAHLSPRFRVACDYGDKVQAVFIEDACGVVSERLDGMPSPDWSKRTEADYRKKVIDDAKATLKAWLIKNFPKFESVTAYWD